MRSLNKFWLVLPLLALLANGGCAPTSKPAEVTVLPTYTPAPTFTPRIIVVTPTATSTPVAAPTLAPTSTPRAEVSFGVKVAKQVWVNRIGHTCIQAAVEITNTGNRPVELGSIVLTLYDVDGKVLNALSPIPVPEIIRPGEAAYAGQGFATVLEDVEPDRVGEIKANFDYKETSKEPQLLSVENLLGREEEFAEYVVTGEVVNTSGNDAGDIRVAVALYDDADNLLGVLTDSPVVTLAPGDRVGFKASTRGLPPGIGKKVAKLVGVSFNWMGFLYHQTPPAPSPGRVLSVDKLRLVS